jgi:hypothetical protein
MNTVKNLHYITSELSEKQIEELEYGASLYRRHANITLKVLKHKKSDKELIVEVRQGKNSLDNYLSVEELNERATNMFGRFFPEYTIHSRPVPYQSPPTDEVTPGWISDKMNKEKIGVKDLVGLTGIDRTNFSAWINGNRPMSQPVKAMFYYLFSDMNKAHKV